MIMEAVEPFGNGLAADVLGAFGVPCGVGVLGVLKIAKLADLRRPRTLNGELLGCFKTNRNGINCGCGGAEDGGGTANVVGSEGTLCRRNGISFGTGDAVAATVLRRSEFFFDLVTSKILSNGMFRKMRTTARPLNPAMFASRNC